MIIVAKIARQVEGEYIMIDVVGAFHHQEKMNEFLLTQKQTQAEIINGVPCVVELGVFENVEFLDQE